MKMTIEHYMAMGFFCLAIGNFIAGGMKLRSETKREKENRPIPQSYIEDGWHGNLILYEKMRPPRVS